MTKDDAQDNAFISLTAEDIAEESLNRIGAIDYERTHSDENYAAAVTARHSRLSAEIEKMILADSKLVDVVKRMLYDIEEDPFDCFDEDTRLRFITMANSLT